MNKLRRFIEHILSFPSAHLWVVGLLGLTAIVQAFNVVLFDTFATGLYLGNQGTHDLAFNFLMAALFLSFSGWIALKIERHYGRGFIPFLILIALLQMSVFAVWHYRHIRVATDLLFLMKWGYRLVVFTGFWSYAFRHIELSLKSKRFLFLVVCEFFGFLIGGFFCYFSPAFILFPKLFVLFLTSSIALAILLWKISNFERIRPEPQLRKNGGVAEKIQLKLVYLIYSVAFLFMSITAFVDYILCLQSLKLAGLNIETNLRFFAVVWILFSFAALFLLTVLYTLRRTFHITTALIMLAFIPLVCCFGLEARLLWVVLFAKVVLDLISYFCIGYYFRIIPRPLSHGRKSRLKITRLIIAQPAGFALSGLFFYFTASSSSILVFGCFLTVAFLFVMFDCQKEYYKVLLSAFKTFRWRGGRLMMKNTKVLNYVEKKANSSNADEAIYFLRVLEEAQVSNLKSHLQQALKHTDIRVRFFALECIERNKLHIFKKTLSDVIDKDENPFVRQKALDVFCSLGEKYAVEKAVLYLDDVKLRKGAITGLLKSGGEEILIASEGINKLAYSRNSEHRLEVAEILQETGLKGFFRIVQKLIDDEDVRVQKVALLAAGSLSHTGLLKSIFSALNDMELHEEALTALQMFGKTAYPFIERALVDDERTELCKKTLISYLWFSQNADSKEVLLRSLKAIDFNLRLYTLHFFKNTQLHSLKKMGKKTFVPLIENDFRQALTTLLLIKDFRFSPIYDAQNTFELLCDSLKRDFENIRQSLLLEVYFCFPSDLMKKSVNILLSPTSSEQERLMAESTLDDLLPKKYTKLKLILKKMPFEELLAKTPSRCLKTEQGMNDQFKFILQSKSYRSPWTKACALGCIRKMNYTLLVPQIVSLLTDKNAIVREGAVWALERLIVSQKELKKTVSVCLNDVQPNVRQLAKEVIR